MQHYDLETDKDGDLPSKPETSERALMKVMRRCQKPIALFIDDGMTWPYRRERAITRHRPYLFYRQGLIAHLRALADPKRVFPLAQEAIVIP